MYKDKEVLLNKFSHLDYKIPYILNIVKHRDISSIHLSKKDMKTMKDNSLNHIYRKMLVLMDCSQYILSRISSISLN